MIWSDLTGDCKQFFLKNGLGLANLNEQKNNLKSIGYSDKNQLGVAGGLIFGMKKTRFNSKDFSTIVISSYSPDPG